MSDQNSFSHKEPRFGKTIKNDFKQLKIKENLGDEYKSLKSYYLTEERKKRLESMGGCRKLFLIPWWLLKALFFKLTPFRRILLIVGLVFSLYISSIPFHKSNQIE